MDKDPQTKKKRITIAAVAIAVIMTVSLVVVLTLPQPPQPTPSYEKKVMFSEVQVSGTPSEQFVELYTWEAPGSDLAGWKLVHGGRNVTIPAISNLGALSYVVLHFGPGTNDTNAVDKNATVYFNLGTQYLDLQGALKLVDHLGRVVDYYNFGNVVPVDPVGWATDDTGITPSPLPYQSMQLWGNDQDNSSNWIVDNSTAGIANAYNFNVTTPEWGTHITVELSTGINHALPATAGGDYRFASEVVVTGTPAPWVSKADITEMADFTLKHYAGLGFMKPYLGPDGKLNIQVSNSSSPFSTGSCDRNGNIKVNLGQKGGMAGKVGTKYTVEHEIMHAIQAHDEGGYDHWGNPADDPLQEGMAAWGGLSSTMKNYNLTWNQTMAYMKEVGKMNWFENFRDTNTTLWPWPASGWDRYMGMGLFVKFLNETYGNGTLGKIMKGVKTYYNGTVGMDVGAQDAIAAECGKSFDQIWRAYHEWLVNGSATAANKFPPLPPHSSPQAPSSPISPPVTDGPKTVAPWGGDIEFINCTGKTARFTIGFPQLGGSEWKITIIYTKPDGTKVTKWFSILGSVSNIPVDPTQWANITVIKTRIGTTGNGSISMKLTPTPPTSLPGEHRENPYPSNCTAATPETTVCQLYDHGGVYEVWYSLWLDTGDILTCSVFNDTGVDNHLWFEVFTLDPMVLPATPPAGDPLADPKTLNLPCLSPSLYSIRIFWNVAEFGLLPPGQSVEVEVSLSISHP